MLMLRTGGQTLITRATHSPLFVTKELFETRYKGAEAIIVAGSVVRGEASTYSDLDLVVIYPHVDVPYRESFYHREWPVEAFIHDSESLRYFFDSVDRPIGRPTLAEMISEGQEVPAPTPVTENLKIFAREVLHEGPPPLTPDEIRERRYHISELVDDIRDPRGKPEMVASASQMYNELADYYFRSRKCWSGRGKNIVRRMKKENPAFSRRFFEAFDVLFGQGDASKVIALAEEILSAEGGFLFEGFRKEEPIVRKQK